MDSTLLQQGSYHTFEGHAARIFSLALCTLHDGTKIAASASHDRTVRVWNISTLAHVRTINYSDFVWRVFLVTSPASRVFIVAFISAEDKIYVSDLETSEQLHMVSGRLVFAGPISLYRSPVIISLVNDVDIKIVDAESGHCLRYISGGFEKAFRAVVSHGHNPILVFNTWNAQNRRSSIQGYDLSSDDSTIDTHDKPPNSKFPATQQGPFEPTKMKVFFEGDSRDGITSLGISQTNKPVICSGHYDNVVRVWDLASLQLLLTLEGHFDWVVSVAIWKGPEPMVVSGSSDGTIKVWDLQTGDLITTCEGHQRDVWAVTVTTGPKHMIVSASADRTVRLWDINPSIQEIKWARRKSFCMFLCIYGLLDRPSAHCRHEQLVIAGMKTGGSQSAPESTCEEVESLSGARVSMGQVLDGTHHKALSVYIGPFDTPGPHQVDSSPPPSPTQRRSSHSESPVGSFLSDFESGDDLDAFSNLFTSFDPGYTDELLVETSAAHTAAWAREQAELKLAEEERAAAEVAEAEAAMRSKFLYTPPPITLSAMAVVRKVLQTQHLCKEVAAFL